MRKGLFCFLPSLYGTVQVLQKLLGHSEITTMKYVHVDEHMMTEAIAALDAKEAA
jgi:site-specific recombinase XerD